MHTLLTHSIVANPSTITLFGTGVPSLVATRPWRNITRFSLGWLGSELGGEELRTAWGVEGGGAEPGALRHCDWYQKCHLMASTTESADAWLIDRSYGGSISAKILGRMSVQVRLPTRMSLQNEMSALCKVEMSLHGWPRGPWKRSDHFEASENGTD